MIDPTVTLALQPAVPLAVVRRTVSHSELKVAVPEGCGVVWSFLRSRGLRGGRNVAVYWDGTIRLEVGVEMAAPFEETSEVVRSFTPAGWTASVIHFGPYDQLGRAHEAIQRWCDEMGHRLAGPNWEVYGHWQSEWNSDPSRIRTDVCYQVVHAELPAG